MARLHLSAPWVILYRQIRTLFQEDPGVYVIYDDTNSENPAVKLYVEDKKKADALTLLLPEGQDFGNVKLTIEVIPANSDKYEGEPDIAAAFNGNAAVLYIASAPPVFRDKITYVVFKKCVVQYWTDDLREVNGIHSTLYEDLARAVLDFTNGVYFCTDSTFGAANLIRGQWGANIKNACCKNRIDDL